jgi:hypothetical protein
VHGMCFFSLRLTSNSVIFFGSCRLSERQQTTERLRVCYAWDGSDRSIVPGGGGEGGRECANQIPVGSASIHNACYLSIEYSLPLHLSPTPHLFSGSLFSIHQSLVYTLIFFSLHRSTSHVFFVLLLQGAFFAIFLIQGTFNFAPSLIFTRN